MRARLAGRLSRALVRWHPRQWRERYGEEMLDVLDQHRSGARTVLNMAGSAASTRLDPAYWEAGASLRRVSQVKTQLAVGSVTFAIVAALGLAPAALHAWLKDRWQLSAAGGVNSVAFFPSQPLLLSASGGAGTDSMDTVWDFADRARPRQLSAFQGGAPTTLSPDGRVVATVTFAGQLALWNVADPRHPARIAATPSGDRNPLWGEAFSPDGRTLAAAYTDRIFLWDVASPARPRLLRVLPAPVASDPVTEPGIDSQGPFSPQDITFSPDGHLLASVTGAGRVTVWNVTDPARAARAAVMAGPDDFALAIAFSPRGHLLAAVTYNGTVAVFSLADPSRPARTATIDSILADALFSGGHLPAAEFACPACMPANYAVAFTPDGRALTVVVSRVTQSGDNAARDTVFTWDVTRSGALTGRTMAVRDGRDSQPTLAPDARTVAEGSPTSNAVYMWTAPGR
jgi:WD40 repeat protein